MTGPSAAAAGEPPPADPDRYVLVTAIVPVGAGPGPTPFLEALARDLGIFSAVVHKSRRAMLEFARGREQLLEAQEEDVITILVLRDRLDEVFAYVHAAVDVAATPGAWLTVAPVSRAAPIVLGDTIPEWAAPKPDTPPA